MICLWPYHGHLWFQTDHSLTIYDTLADHSKIMYEILYDLCGTVVFRL